MFFRYMQAYREGATGLDVLQKVKQLKKSHRVPMLLEQQPREAYSRNRGRILAGVLSGREREDEGGDEGEEEVERSSESEIVFDQKDFAGLTSQYLNRCPKGKAWALAKIGKRMRKKVGPMMTVTGMDYMVWPLFFDEIVEEQRKLEDDREREMRERFEFGFAGEMAGVSFRNTREKVEIGQNETQEEE